jgi:hypothetical protein
MAPQKIIPWKADYPRALQPGQQTTPEDPG